MGNNEVKTMENMKSLIKNSDWETMLQQYTPDQVAVSHTFEKGMLIADKITERGFEDETLLNYALDIFFSIRDRYPEKWDQDWKNDIYVATLCTIPFRYVESFASIKRAYKRHPDPPSSLIYEYADTYNYPPEAGDTISQEESIKLFKRAIEKELTYESAVRLSGVYRYRKDKAKARYWEAIAKEAERKNLHKPSIIPDLFSQKDKSENLINNA